MKKLKTSLLLITMVSSISAIKAQNPLSQKTQVEVGIGFIRPNFRKGTELLRAYEFRKSGLSYYADAQGNRESVGKYSASSGNSLTIGFYKPVKLVKGLMLGALVRNAQTGSTPNQGGYAEAYFFNFITAGLAAKYYPLASKNLFVKADFGLAAVLTKNRFLNDVNQQSFFHQFGIGSAWGFEAGYALLPFKNKSRAIELKVGYQLANTRVEVNGIGNDQWQFGAWYVGTSFNF
jgi:hypothetical protein